MHTDFFIPKASAPTTTNKQPQLLTSEAHYRPETSPQAQQEQGVPNATGFTSSRLSSNLDYSKTMRHSQNANQPELHMQLTSNSRLKESNSTRWN